MAVKTTTQDFSDFLREVRGSKFDSADFVLSEAIAQLLLRESSATRH
jgi:hypothetical protein